MKRFVSLIIVFLSFVFLCCSCKNITMCRIKIDPYDTYIDFKLTIKNDNQNFKIDIKKEEDLVYSNDYEYTKTSGTIENLMPNTKYSFIVSSNDKVLGSTTFTTSLGVFKNVTFENETFEYDNENHSIFVKGLPEGANVVYTNNSNKEIGSYEVIAKITKENYNDLTLKATMSIVEPDVINIYASDVSVEYTGNPVLISASALNYELEYDFYDGETKLESAPINVGKYKCQISLKNTDKKFNEKTINVEITKATPTIKSADIETYKNCDYTVKGDVYVNKKKTDLTVSYSYYLDGQLLDEKPTTPGLYTCVIKFNGDNNLFEVEKEIKINISKFMKQTPIIHLNDKKIPETTKNKNTDYILEGQLLNITLTNGAGLTVTINGNEYESEFEDNKYSFTTMDIKNCGEYVVVIKCPENDIYALYEKTFTIKVNEVTIDSVILVDNQNMLNVDYNDSKSIHVNVSAKSVFSVDVDGVSMGTSELVDSNYVLEFDLTFDENGRSFNLSIIPNDQNHKMKNCRIKVNKFGSIDKTFEIESKDYKTGKISKNYPFVVSSTDSGRYAESKEFAFKFDANAKNAIVFNDINVSESAKYNLSIRMYSTSKQTGACSNFEVIFYYMDGTNEMVCQLNSKESVSPETISSGDIVRSNVKNVVLNFNKSGSNIGVQGIKMVCSSSNGNNDDDHSHIEENLIYNDFQVHFLELGNQFAGDCVYIKAGNYDILIDAGSRNGSSTTISNYLNKYVTDNKLEFVIATHAHQDHIAGFVGNNKDGILYSYKVDTIIDYALQNTKSQIAKDYKTAVNYAVSNGAKHYTADKCFNNLDGAKSTYELGPDMSFKILYNYYYFNSTSDENEYSVCTLFTYKQNNYIFTGDLEGSGEKKLAEYYDGSEEDKTLPSCVLFKGGHHGSKTSSTDALLSKIKPQICCVCCCAGSDEYTGATDNMFPTQDFINRISKYTDRVYVTTIATFTIMQAQANAKGASKVTGVEVGHDYLHTTGFESFNGNIIVSTNQDGDIGLFASNNLIKLKDSSWFNSKIVLDGVTRQMREMPQNWVS